MTSSHGSIFCVTGLLYGEFTGHRWIPLTKASDAEYKEPITQSFGFLLLLTLLSLWTNSWLSCQMRLINAHFTSPKCIDRFYPYPSGLLRWHWGLSVGESTLKKMIKRITRAGYDEKTWDRNTTNCVYFCGISFTFIRPLGRWTWCMYGTKAFILIVLVKKRVYGNSYDPKLSNPILLYNPDLTIRFLSFTKGTLDVNVERHARVKRSRRYKLCYILQHSIQCQKNIPLSNAPFVLHIKNVN